MFSLIKRHDDELVDERNTESINTVQLFVLAPFRCHDADIKFERVVRPKFQT